MRTYESSPLASPLMSGALLLAVIAVAVPRQQTLPPCTTPPYSRDVAGNNTAVQNSWPQGTAVTVIIDEHFSPEQRQAVEAGFNNWLNSGHGVTFSFVVGQVPATRTRPPPDTVYVLADPVNRADNENFYGSHGQVSGAYMRVGRCTRPENLVGKTAHEAGHEFGLANCDGCEVGSSIMARARTGMDGDTCNAAYPAGMNGPRDCDFNAVLNSGAYDPPPPTPAINCVDNDGDGYGVGPDCWFEDCDDWNPDLTTNCGGDRENCGDCSMRCLGVGAWCDPWCTCYTPVLIDTEGDGFRLTSARDGVHFDIDGDPATLNRLGWTEAGSDDAWLALDRDGNGRIDGGRELFGDRTPQAPSDDPNGFSALAEFDRPEEGGNADGVIDGGDAVFARLRLWRDSNHDGVSQPGELHALPSLGVGGVDLGYRESRRRDRHGNVFRYRAKVYGAGRARPGRWAYDVFPVPPR